MGHRNDEPPVPVAEPPSRGAGSPKKKKKKSGALNKVKGVAAWQPVEAWVSTCVSNVHLHDHAVVRDRRDVRASAVP